MIGLNFGHNAATRYLLAAAPAALLFACGSAIADVTIVGAITNCDVTNTTPEVCDEMEIELEGPHASDVVYTWRNYNYGAPTITDLPGNTGVRVSYHAAGRVTQRNAVEHFGITLRDFSVLTRRTFRWKHNGVVVMAGPGANVQIPIPVTYIPPAPVPVVTEVIENESPEQVMWIRRSIHRIPGVVTLDQLMSDNPIITGATVLETELFRLDPGDVLESVENLDTEDYLFSQIIVVENYADIPTFNAATGDWDHAAGALTSRNMSATIIQQTPCSVRPVLTLEPVSVAAPLDGTAEFDALATGQSEFGQLNYQWFHDGVAMTGEDSEHLRVDPVTPADVGYYVCIVTNDCGQVTTHGVQLTIAINCSQADIAGGNPGGDGTVDGNDFIAFINSFSIGDPEIDPAADVEGGGPNNDRPDGTIDGGDFIAFINAFAAGC